MAFVVGVKVFDLSAIKVGSFDIIGRADALVLDGALGYLAHLELNLGAKVARGVVAASVCLKGPEQAFWYSWNRMQSISRRAMLGFFAILTLAGGLRFFQIGGNSFWVDEYCSEECASGRGLANVALPQDQWIHPPRDLTDMDSNGGARSVWSIWTSLRYDNHPPLYFILLRVWRQIFGPSDGAARSLSAIVSILSVAILFDICRLRHGTTVAFWASAIMAVAMPQIHFAQETRGYSLLVTLLLGACDALVRIEVGGWSKRRGIALALLILGSMLTHYYAVAFVAALGLYAGIKLVGQTRRRTLGGICIAIGLFAICWGPFLLQQRGSFDVNNTWQSEPGDGHLLRTLVRIAILPVRFLNESWSAYSAARIGVIFFIMPLLLLRKRPELLLWTLCLLIPIAMVCCIDLFRTSRQLEVARYTLLAMPAFYVICALLFEQHRWMGHVAPILVLVVCLMGIPKTFVVNTDWRELAEQLRANIRPGEPVVFCSMGRDNWYASELYMGIAHEAPGLVTETCLLTQPAKGEVLGRLNGAQRVWLVTATPDVAPETIVPGYSRGPGISYPGQATLWTLTRSPKQ